MPGTASTLCHRFSEKAVQEYGSEKAIQSEDADSNAVEACPPTAGQADQLQEITAALESEHAKRQELEKEIANLKEEQQQWKQSQRDENKDESATNNISVVALRAEVEGFRQLVDAMTLGKPAMGAASIALSQRQPNSIPLHIVRFLELMPWHPEAQKAAVVTEEMYEWQVYHPVKKAWSSELIDFPTFFQALPLVSPSWNGREKDTSRAGKVMSLPKTNDKVGVWTDQNLVHRYELRDGYLLPKTSHGPTWTWVGGWSVDVDTSSRTIDNNKTTSSCCIEDYRGWSYAKQAGHFIEAASGTGLISPSQVPDQLAKLDVSSHLWRSHNTAVDDTMVRRRKWQRKRVLVDYPMASEYTQNYLRLILEREETTVATSKRQHYYTTALRALKMAEELHLGDQQMWEREKQKLQKRIEKLEAKVEHQERSLEREKGPHCSDFDLSELKSVEGKILDGDTSGDDESIVISEENGLANRLHRTVHLMLHPEGETINRRSTSGGDDGKNKASLLRWIHPQAPTLSNKNAHLPEVEPCSDDSNNSFSEFSDEENDTDASLLLPPSPRAEKNKSFLHFFAKK